MDISLTKVAGQSAAPEYKTEAAEADGEFYRLLQEVDEYLESQRKTPEQKRLEEQEAQEKRVRQKKMQDLRLRIAALRQQMMMGAEGVAGELAVLESQLMMMQLFME